ncbi:MAG TPA: hypothetical protein VED01_07715 [Burkholderiales bacterium]|nr:hypothetical protein [Burkholderiales bacterium]
MAEFYWHKDRLTGLLAFGRVDDDGLLAVIVQEGFPAKRQARCCEFFEWHVTGAVMTSECEWRAFDDDEDFADEMERWYRRQTGMSHGALLEHVRRVFALADAASARYGKSGTVTVHVEGGESV